MKRKDARDAKLSEAFTIVQNKQDNLLVLANSLAMLGNAGEGDELSTKACIQNLVDLMDRA